MKILNPLNEIVTKKPLVAVTAIVVITMMMMFFFNLTLNIMTLAGLALGIGMLVDNSIVVLENIYRYREKGAKLHTAAILGTKEMMVAITASTLTTICVFLPLAIFRSQLEFYGEMFSGLAFTIVIALATSLVEAIVLAPVLASKYFSINTRLELQLPPFLERIDKAMERFFRRLEKLYKKITKSIPIVCVDLVIKKRGRTLLIKRKLPPRKGYWCLIGCGKRHPSRKAENLLRRKLGLAPRGVKRLADMPLADLRWRIIHRAPVL